MNKSFKKFFNMVEVTLAIAVVGIGVAGIMSLFPVAVSATRESVADNYAADAADQMISYISLRAKASWSNIQSSVVVASTEPDPTDTSITGSYSFPNSTGLDNIVMASAGEYKITQGSGNGIVDFSAVIKVWRTQLPSISISGQATSSNWDSPFNYGAGIHIQICYPAEAPPATRKKINYYYEIFKNN